MLRATRRPTVLSRAQFEQVTGEKTWPAYLAGAVKNDQLDYFTNNDAVFTIRGVHISVSVNWEYESQPGVKDSYFASYRRNYQAPSNSGKAQRRNIFRNCT